MSDPLTLARRLSALRDEELTEILVRRPVAAREVRDFFDLADALLSPTSVAVALRAVSRPALEWLATGDGSFADLPHSDRRMLARLHLVETTPAVTSTATLTPSATLPTDAGATPATGSGAERTAAAEPVVYDAVRDAAAEALAGAAALASASLVVADADAPVGSPDQRAFAAIAAVAEIGHQLRLAPARVRARGGIPATEERRLGPILGIEPDQVGIVVELATAAGLTALERDVLHTTTRAAEWNILSPGARWLALSTAWLDSLEEPVRRTLEDAGPQWASGSRLRAEYTHRFPASSAAMRAELDRIDTIAAFLGLLDSAARDSPTVRSAPAGTIPADAAPADTGSAGGARADATPAGAVPADTASARGAEAGSTPPGTAFAAAALSALRGDRVDTAALDALLPPEIDRVYLQHDLSVIAPGPLAPEIDARLRSLAEIENRGLASSYRITQATIDRALSSGETEQTLRTFLGEVSLTGIPQALDYLLTEGGRRHGLVRVRQGDLTLIRSADGVLLRALAVDQALGPLGLRPGHGGELVSRVDPVTSYWMLVDARYPTVAEDGEGHEVPMNRGRVIEAPSTAGAAASGTATASPAVHAAAAAFLLGLRQADAQSADDSTAWIARQLDKAVRSRTPVTLDVRMPDGSTTRLDATPLALSNGRLRCVDVRAGVERTVPVANIVELTTH